VGGTLGDRLRDRLRDDTCIIIECMCLTADTVEQMQPDSRYSGSMLLREALYI
jgi:hypothetical protein